MQFAHLNKNSLIVALGSMLEYYDFALFSLFLPIMAGEFFPGESSYASLSKGYSALMITLIARPLGAIVLGKIGDFQSRQKALIFSMYGIALATLAIGLIPSYALIGVGAPILVVIAKCIQAFCFGGEFNGAGVYVVEKAQTQPAQASSVLTAITFIGSLLASLIGILLMQAYMPTWSWRIAFLLGGIIGLVGIHYRKKWLHTHVMPSNPQKFSFSHLIKQYPKEILAGIFIGGFSTTPFSMVLIFINPVLATRGYISNSELMILETILILVAIFSLLFSGKIADRTSPAYVMKWGCLLLFVFAYPLGWLIDTGINAWIVLSEIIIIIINEILLGPANAYLTSLFPPQYRYRATSFSFCLGMSLFGGSSIVIENNLYQLNYHFDLAMIWLMVISFGTYWAIQRCQNSRA